MELFLSFHLYVILKFKVGSLCLQHKQHYPLSHPTTIPNSFVSRSFNFQKEYDSFTLKGELAPPPLRSIPAHRRHRALPSERRRPCEMCLPLKYSNIVDVVVYLLQEVMRP